MSDDGTRAAAAWYVTRDGKRISDPLPDENACVVWLQRYQGQSVSYAMRHAGYGIESPEARAASAPEISERARWVTEQVTLWITNDSVWLQQWVWKRTPDSGAEELRVFLTKVLREARKGSAAWHVAQELAANDYERIHWDDVLREISDMEL